MKFEKFPNQKEMSKITEIYQLTLDVTSIFPENFIDNICDDFSSYDDEGLRDQDFTYGKISSVDGILNFIHGFPGDNPSGVFYDDQFNIKARVGEGMDPINDFEKWYYDLTKEVTELNMFCVYRKDNIELI